MPFEKMREQFSSFASEMAQSILRQVEAEVTEGLNAIRASVGGKASAAASAALSRNAAAKVASLAAGKPAAKGRKSSSQKGVKRDMHCRVVGCPNPSKGPRFGYFCEKHQSLTAKEKEKAKAEYAEKQAK